ncbi:hypothetical protein EW146_g790 [Bondarzewia mesenterica]|uniref:Midasin n=1 Tax=Bondarzewia mesenterica TaxID=1095465 RepID=A0A4S4M7N5_9AGAM|nr:hypothetical protein EW146_g790 [Bondarzewia mesenterica]
MAALDCFHNPLTIGLQEQISTLLSHFPHSNHVASLGNCSSRRDILNALSNLLLIPSLTTFIATTFRPLLLDLCARWLQNGDLIEEKISCLCFLLQPHEELYPVLAHFLRHYISEDGPLEFVLSSSSPQAIDVVRLHRILLAYYRILQANRELPHYLHWSLDPLSRLIWAPHPDRGVLFLAIRCYALQSCMGEAERERMEREVIGPEADVDCPIQFGMDESETSRVIDGWMLPIIEAKRIGDSRNAIASDSHNFYAAGEDDPIQSDELCPLIVSIHGVLMLREVPASHIDSALISTSTTVQALRALTLHVSLRLPTLITSTPSAGKSLILSHLAAVLHPNVKNQIIAITLADTSLDPRSLLGSYISSPTNPGTFEWKEGILVRAMREGRWVVFEDIDRGSNEVLGTIKPLVESLCEGKWIGDRARLEVPNRGAVIAAENFALFATRSSTHIGTGVFTKATFFGAHKFKEVIVPTPTLDELQTIINSRFPRLSGGASQSIIHLWDSVRAFGMTASHRDVGLRELEKFCSRIDCLLTSSRQPMDTDPVLATDSGPPRPLWSIYHNPSLREEMYVEARDVFFGAGTLTASARTHAEAIAAVIGEHLSLSPEQRDWVLNGRVPEFENERDVNGRTISLRLGRVRLSAKMSKMEITPPAMRPFAMHRPAVRLMSRIASAASLAEPVLLTGETGTGKTSVVTHMAALLRRPLVSLNLSQQTESSDLLGGFKPVDARVPGSQLQERFLELFRITFSQKKNAKFEASVRKAVQEGKWKRAVGLWKESARLAKERIQAKMNEMVAENANKEELDADGPRKRRKTGQASLHSSETNWADFEQRVTEFDIQHVQGKGKFAFSFIEGPLVKALRSGDWYGHPTPVLISYTKDSLYHRRILLDEINLASPETLEAVSGLLHGPAASITLTEQGSLEPIPRHPDFRLFACMNPATDVGKKDLPPNIRSRFTEIDVPPPDADRETLLSIVTQYIGASAVGDKGAIMDVAEFYTAVKKLAEERQIADGSNHRPHFSMRTLARALTFASDIAPNYSLRRALWEGCLMAFTMVLDAPSAELVTTLAQKHILAGVRNPRSLLAQEPAVPNGHSSDEFVKFGHFFLERGPIPEDAVDDYIMTPSVQKKLIDLARIIITRRFPVLIEGPTSSGKTSSIEYLAKRTGHRFVRINNHEHTDIQEYLGTYVSDPATGKLVFHDGLLVQALRQGDWIVLDELNLAPTDVLEALNRLLDDNRELVIPETQEVVRPHPHFLLFATQNPPGLYGGRKVLSRAFRNRFLEVHFEDVPQAELKEILCQRCRIAPSYGERIVGVFRELQQRRQSSRVFESKHGFATLRDLFRWAGRDAVGYQELAENGYMLLAERTRRDDDKVVVKEVIESIMKVQIDETSLYDFHRNGGEIATALGFSIPSSSPLVWTKAMQRLLVLVGRALRFNEPVLLVGETGSGKTSICQVYADAVHKRLFAVNCHQNTETADLIGGLRPVRNRTVLEAEALQEAAGFLAQNGIVNAPSDVQSLLSFLNQLSRSSTTQLVQAQVEDVRHKLQRLQAIFEWCDGPLVEAMRHGDVLLLDEISLADDSVLERLNSVLEPGRTVVLAERGGDDVDQSIVKAEPGFKLVATMNPGGDYGKKELSPALRNRFTEIWVPSVDNRQDLSQIVDSSWRQESLKPYTNRLLNLCDWLSDRVSEPALLGLRDILAWVAFSNSVCTMENAELMSANEIFHHAAHMTILDGLGSLPQLASYSAEGLRKVKNEALSKLQEIAPIATDNVLSNHTLPNADSHLIRLGAFAVPRGPADRKAHSYTLQAPTTRNNAMRVIRACQVPKPILLEGSPGVGKTSLITALANLCGYHLCRINLSDQTDLADLFGSDLPVEGGGPGEFAWKNAEFLTALQEGHWVLLDEMNLAPQAVLEGLNAVLDHRGTVYLPELGRSFTRHPSFRIFAAQNPIHQGGGRKGLPKSFVNRFTKVFIEPLTPVDLLEICRHLFPDYPSDWLQSMITYNARLEEEVVSKKTFARTGTPWEFNLRDVTRWGALLTSSKCSLHPVEHLRDIYLARFRTNDDKTAARRIFDQIFAISSDHLERVPYPSVSSSYVQIGHFITSRSNYSSPARSGRLLQSQLALIETIGTSLRQGWLITLTGPHDSGKTGLVRFMAELTGNSLYEVAMNSSTDTTDILGSFEQLDSNGHSISLVRRTVALIDRLSRSMEGSKRLMSRHSSALKKIADVQSPSILDLNILRAAKNVLDELGDLDSDCARERIDLLDEIQNQFPMPASAGKFEWVDGPLIRAMRQGHWLLLDSANLCSPSVLDRLNSLCEPSGVLILSERGYVGSSVQVIKPHPDFRLFMCVDPHHGELSRAMRNRGIEVAVPVDRTLEDLSRLRDYFRLPEERPEAGFSAHMSCLEFEGLRRALFTTTTTSNAYWPSGQSLCEDSPSSAVLHRAPLLFPSPTTLPSQVSSDSILSFAVISSPPAYASHLSRYAMLFELSMRPDRLTQLSAVLDALRKSTLWGKLDESRRQMRQIWPVSHDFLSVQPFDFLAKSITLCHSYPELDRPSVQHSILRVLELFIRLFADDHAKRSAVELSTSKAANKSFDAPANRRAMKAVEEVVDCVHRLGMDLLAHFGENSEDAFGDIKLSLKLQKFSQFMRIKTADAFDFSAIQTIVKWINNALCNTPRLLWHYASRLPFSSAWSLHRQDWTNLAQLEALACSGEEAYELRSRILELMAIETLPISMPGADKGAIERTSQDIQSVIKTGQQRSLPESLKDDPISVIKELAVIISIGTRNKDIGCDHVLRLACQNSDGPLTRFVPYRHAAWALGVDGFKVATLAQLHRSWMQALWNIDNVNANDGPSILLQPTELRGTIIKCDWDKVSLRSLKSYEHALKRHSELILSDFGAPTSRLHELSAFYRQALLMLSFCFPESFDENTRTALQNACTGHLTDLHDSLLKILKLMQQSSHSYFCLAVQRSLESPVSLLEASASQASSAVALGQCLIALFRMFVELYVPDTPLDPSASRRCTFEFWRQEHLRLSTELQLQVQLERRTTGNCTNTLTIYLEHELDIVKQHLDESAAPFEESRHDVTHLKEFWSEVSQFMTQVASSAKLDSLLGLLHSGDSASNTREHVMQQSIAGFCQRLDAVYADFEDISSPLQWAFLYLRLGIRLISRAHLLHHNDGAGIVAGALVVSPSVRSATMLRSQPIVDVQIPGLDAVQSLILSMAATTFELSIGIDLDSLIESLHLVYEQAVRLWQIDRTREEEANKASQSLYRSTRMEHDSILDSEMEEREFLALFPNFENTFDPDYDASHTAHHTPTLIDSSSIQKICDFHLLLWQAGSATRDSLETSSLFSQNRNLLLQSIVAAHLETLPGDLDQASFAYQLSLLNERLSDLRKQSRVTRPYNFYLDANVPEVQKATAVVEALDQRVESLTQEWPDQMVLHHLRERCVQVLCLNLKSPVAKVLAALEQLLLQTEDWELYANRHNNLKDHRHALTSLIVEWRQLELSSWRGLLETQAALFEDGVSEWWFRLYDALVRGLLDVVEGVPDHGPGSLDTYLGTLVPLVDDFIKTSPMGQFQRRLTLLASFEYFIHRLVDSKTGEQANALRRIARILHATRSHYIQYLPRVLASFTSQRSVLETEITGFIKLASWRDVNVQALRQSAQRTHHQLYKNIRKFRDIMRQPTDELLRSERAGDLDSVPTFTFSQLAKHVDIEKVNFPDRVVLKSGPAHLQDLSRTFKKYDSLLATRIESFILSCPSHSVEALAADVINTAKSLSDLSVPSDVPKERKEKQLKGILVRKRKAWSDLLKELKRIGFAVNVKPEVSERQRNECWIREQPVVLSPRPDPFDVSKVEHYFHRLQSLLPEVRAALSGHHPDLPTRELQRGVLLLESGFSVALGVRAQLVTMLNGFDRLNNVARRLHMFVNSGKVVRTGSKALEDVIRVKDTTCRFVHALSEMIRNIEMFDELSPGQRVPVSLLVEARSRLALTTNHRDNLSAVVDAMRMMVTPILLEDEYAVVSSGANHLEQFANILELWEKNHPHLQRLLSPLRTWIESQAEVIPFTDTVVEDDDFNPDHVIDALLVTVQSILSKLPDDNQQDQPDDDDSYTKITSNILGEISNLLQVASFTEKLDLIGAKLPNASPETGKTHVLRVLPFIDRYVGLVEQQMVSLIRWAGSLLKLQYVVCSIINTVATQGFCKPPDMDESGEGKDGGDAVGGVGLGEGTGSENVSKEIEDESQVEGLKGDGGENNQERQKGGDEEEDAIEMGDDFEGEMEDLPETGSQHGEDEEEEDEAEETEGPDEQIGDIDKSDPSAVDEKLWGDEKGPEDTLEKERAADDDVCDEQIPEDGIEDQGDIAPDGDGGPIDDRVQDANTLDLPDDLDLGTGEETQEDASPDDDDQMLEDGLEEREERLSDFEGADDAEQGQESTPEPMDEGNVHSAYRREETQEDDDDQPEGDRPPDDAVAQPDLQSGDGFADAMPEESLNSNDRENVPARQSGGTRGSSGQTAGVGEETSHEDGETEESRTQADASERDNNGRGSAMAGAQQSNAPSQESSKRELASNPLRSLGDTLKEIRQRFDDILESGEAQDQATPQPADTAETSQLEYLRPGDVDHEIQALGPAEADQVAKLSELKLVEDERQADVENSFMDIDDPEASIPPSHHPQTSALPFQNTAQSLQEDVESALTHHEIRSSNAMRTWDRSPDDLAPRSDFDMKEPEDQEYVESELRRWQAEGRRTAGAENLWQLYASLTHDLSYALCEQLRLILEPTLATRLKGDYRTGKRLNMKKIIPYIASEYTKDKIWLRRTRPSQREYQVLIALDDSRSMSESHSVHLAYETLALVSKALSRLEVGDIGIAKFGEVVDVLHGFDEGPFTDQAGMRVMGSFNFSQKATNVLSLVESSLKILEEARGRRSTSSASAADLWQLEIIISDGICQDHDRLRTILRKAEEQRVMIVFIVIDSLHSNTAAAATLVGSASAGAVLNSILSMNQVAYKQVDGRMELQMQRYLDSFPFEYYVVLRSVEALPEVLSSTLKQFFELVEILLRIALCVSAWLSLSGGTLGGKLAPDTNGHLAFTSIMEHDRSLSRFQERFSFDNSPHDDLENATDDERKGLLSSAEDTLLKSDDGSDKGANYVHFIRSSAFEILGLVGVMILILLVMSVASLLANTSGTSRSAKSLHFDGDTLRSNGTHQFKRTVLIVSIDGLRADYLERGLTPHLLDISKQGLRARSMKPIFPTLTFPTGLYAESHGIVANNFWDSETDSEFHYNQISSCWQPHWWMGEPMWETAGKAGVINANLMWPGPPKTLTGATPTNFIPWRDRVSLREKLDQIMAWVDLPLEDRPQLIMAYEPSLDQAGHAAGPHSALVNVGLAIPELIYMDDILGEQGWASIEHEDDTDALRQPGWPSMGLHFNTSDNAAYYLDVLLAAAAGNKEKFQVFTPETMPERYHFAHSPRIAPIYVVPKVGYVLTTRKDGDVGLTKGNHGYDNDDPSMHAMFVAHGPFSSVAKVVHQSRSSNFVSRALSHPNQGWHSVSDDTYVMETFQNVEIYGLVMKLLGIEKIAATTNSTKGFWDKYF